jgi:hypothetical protein
MTRVTTIAELTASIAHVVNQPRSGIARATCGSRWQPRLFADDDISLREALELLIRDEGWQPETLVSAREFLDRPRVSVPTFPPPFATPTKPAKFRLSSAPAAHRN